MTRVPIVLGWATMLLAGAAPSGPGAPGPEIPADRAQQLRRNLEAFEKLPPDEQEQLRRLHTAVKASGAEREELEAAMARYVRWLDTLTPSQRARIASAASADTRLETVRQILVEREARLARELAPLSETLPMPSPDGRGPGPGSGTGPGPMQRILFAMEFGRQLIQLTKELSEVVKANAGRLEPGERQRVTQLADTASGHRMFYMMALAAKYNLDVPEESRQTANRLIELLYAEAKPIHGRYGTPAHRELGSAQQKDFEKVLVTLFLLLPPVDEATLEGSLDAEGRKWFHMAQRNPLVYQMLVFQYYRHHPEAVPEECRLALKEITGDLMPPDPRRGSMRPRPGFPFPDREPPGKLPPRPPGPRSADERGNG